MKNLKKYGVLMSQLFLVNFFYVFNTYAQFPSFNTTYKMEFLVKSGDFFSEQDIYELNENFREESTDSDLMVDVFVAHEISCYYLNRVRVLEEERSKVLRKISEVSSRADIEEEGYIFRLNKSVLHYNTEIELNTKKSRFFSSINKYYGRPGTLAKFLPVKRSYEGEFFYSNVSSKGVSTLTSFVIQGNESSGTATTDVISAMVGFVKVGLTSVFYAGSDEEESESNTRIFSGGGLTNLRFEFPLFFSNSRNFLVYSSFKPGFIADIPVFGSGIEREAFSGYYELPIELLAELRTNNSEFSLFANFKGARIEGTNAFYQTLKPKEELEEADRIDKPFWISQVYLGVSMSGKFKISMNLPIATSSKIAIPDTFQIGIQVIPSKN
ncbi:hypothetical protein LZF95_09745 [Algoriphagus sp. AGSA1]|uniref:hypothetical protein n=1 Tax=Algoriphagus sp. AGSA1 TaxID=2907213 RepID=UPI001F27F204|nr:hypothetical protein [Algoriphagus sp. AGSA1]MCE7054955.1 hypothetical protein [Algoriphagus sp. AGSA1]